MYRLQIAVIAWAVSVLLAGIGGWWVNGLRHTKALEAERRANTELMVAAVSAARTEEQRRVAKHAEVSNAARTAQQRAQADAVRAAAVSASLRQHITRLAASCSGNPAIAGAGQAGTTTADLLADMLGRLDQAARDIAAHADANAVAGKACANAYDSLQQQAQ
jgi:hypothetical protein